MFITMGVALYTSRVILKVLGVEDYGIFNVVAGVVSMLSFLNTSLSGATTRFLTYELGKGDRIKLNKTFSTSIAIHIALGLIIIVLLEALGPWFINNKLSIPIDRLDASIIVFHFSVLTCFIQIVQLPYNAAIIAHEKMSAFAYISIIDVVLKLAIVYLLQVISIDKLIAYSVLFFIASFCTSLMYIVYAWHSFEECVLRPRYNKVIGKPIMSFSGWDLFGNLSVVVRSQGLNILQNTFFGPIVNASTAISNQVLTAIMGFSENFLTAVKPQITKYYAADDLSSFIKLVISSSRYCTLLLFLISFPILLEANYILNLWLVEVPEYAVVFCQLSIVNNWISIMFRPIVLGIHATGNIRKISTINGLIYISVLPLSYVFLKNGASPAIPFILNIILLIVAHTTVTLKVFKNNVRGFEISEFFVQSVLKSFIVIFLSSILPILIHLYVDEGFYRLVICTIVSVLLVVSITYLIAVPNEDKYRIKMFVRKRYESSNE